MIIITGASGFIGQATSVFFKENTQSSLVLVDFLKTENQKLKECQFIHTDNLFDFLDLKNSKINFIIHLGAITDTTEKNVDLLNKYNLFYSKVIWRKCVKYSIPLIYASSAATYGDGKFGFSDDHEKINLFNPLNLYAQSKHEFDKYILSEKEKPPFWYGLKFFNVFGFDESKKEKMASIIFQAFHQILATNKMKLFKSNDSKIKDGAQCRDFIYINDIIDVILFLYSKKVKSGIYNIGTGNGTSVLEMVKRFMSVNNIDIPYKLVDRRQGDIDIVYCSTDKVYNEWGWKPKFTLDDICRDSWNFAIKNHEEI